MASKIYLTLTLSADCWLPVSAAVDNNEGEWDDDWDDQSVDEEGGVPGQSVHGPSVKISLNR